MIVCKLLALDKDSWNHITLYKLLVLDRNTLKHMTVLFVLKIVTWSYNRL